MTIVRVEISQIRHNKIVSLVFWGNLGNEIVRSYRTNDYLLIEGYTSIKKKNLKLSNSKLNKLIITVLKVYPLVLNSSLLTKKKLN